jgi:hypothetical protein
MRHTISAILLTLCLSMTAAWALPSVIVKIDQMTGTVVEASREKSGFYTVVRMKLAKTTSPEDTKRLYSVTRKANNRFAVNIRDYNRPSKDQVIVVLSKDVLPTVPKVGDVLRISEYAITGNRTDEPGMWYSPSAKKAEMNPKG